MHVASILHTCIIHVSIAQHVYTKTLELEYLNTISHAKTTNYGQIPYKTILEPFEHIYHQDY